LVQAGNKELFDHNASVADGLVKLGLTTKDDLIPGMEVTLMDHQVIGVEWMVEQEKGPNRGGCLADDMGLGKVCWFRSHVLEFQVTMMAR